MEHIEKQILRYPELSPDEREAMETYVEEHPRWQGLLSDVKALEQVLAQARALGADPPSREVLAHYLVTPRIGTLPPALKEAFSKIEAALEEEERGEALRARLEALIRRRRDLEAESRGPAVHFEELTGHTLDEKSPDAAGVVDSMESEAEESAAGAEHSGRAARLWAFMRLASLPRSVRYGAAFVLALVVLYGALFAGGRLAQSKMERLASLDEDRLSVDGYGLTEMRTRGGGTLAPDDSTSLDARYLRSLRLLREARSSTFGLFPRYDEVPLREAERRLSAVASEAEDGSFVQLEALFFLGKARLALGDKAGATEALRQVVAGGGRLAPEAQQILEALYEEAAYDGPPGGE